LMNAALLFLTEAWRYEQVEDTDLTAAETAAKWYEIYVQYLTGECEGVGCCTELRTDPNTGTLQYSNDGGLSWFDVAEGPWVDVPNVPTAAPPPPLNQGTDEADRCLAAWNAADVIAEFYRQTAGAAAAGLYNTLLSMNMFLNELNNALLEIAYPQAGRLLNASGFLDFDWGEYASAPTLDSTAMEALRCLLYTYASVTAGVVSFDHGAVYDNLIAELGVNPGTAVTLLVGYMGEAGLNHAGGILANDTADCEECNPTWCYQWDFTEGLGGWEIVFGTLTGAGVEAGNDTANSLRRATIERTSIENLQVSRVEMEYSGVAGNTATFQYATMVLQRTGSADWRVDQQPWCEMPTATDCVFGADTGGYEADNAIIRVVVDSSTGGYTGNGIIQKVRMYGPGENPFGEDNCT